MMDDQELCGTLHVANAVRDFIRTGLVIDRIDVAVVRAELSRCECMGPWEEDHATFVKGLLDEATESLRDSGKAYDELHNVFFKIDEAREDLEFYLDNRPEETEIVMDNATPLLDAAKAA